MRYMLLIYSPESAWTKEDWTKCTVDSTGICQELHAKGQLVTAAPLHPVATASTVRVRDGQQWVTTGPFAETTEQLGGYYILDVADLDEAIEIASRLPPASKGTVEIRPLLPLKELPKETLDAPGVSNNQFLLICYDDEKYWTEAGPAAHRSAMMEAVQLTNKLADQGQYVSSAPLYPVASATSVRIRDGRRIVTDGPFAETREVVGGYHLIRVDELEEALAIAGQHPGARVGSVEVRRVFDLSEQMQAQASGEINRLAAAAAPEFQGANKPFQRKRE